MARLKFFQELKSLAHFRLDDDVAGTQAPANAPYLLEDRDSWAGKPVFDHAQVIEQLDTGAKIQGKTISFGFLDGRTSTGTGEYAGFSPLSESQKDATRDSMKLWDDLIAARIVEKGGNSADIVLGNTSTGPAQAWAYYPTEDGNPATPQSSIWIADPAVNWTNAWVSYGGYGQSTLVHEIGHSLGLSHPGDYNFGADEDGDGVADPIRYASDAEYAQDSQEFTIMSYFLDWETGSQAFDPSLLVPTNPQTPLLHDILAIQAKYGADPTTRAGNTVYFANSTAGNAVYDLEHNPFPYLSVYDAGGNDTFDFSSANSGVFLDLRAGAFSSASAGTLSLDEAEAALAAYNALKPEGVGGVEWNPAFYDSWTGYLTSDGARRVEGDTGVDGVTATLHRNISIAYNTVIENAIGGESRDYLVGNEVANLLKGNGGDDVLNGLGGNDLLWGGAGADEFRFFAGSGIDAIVDFLSGTDTINLAEIDADTFAEGDQAFDFILGNSFSHTAGELLSYSILGAHFLAGDADGDALADFVISIGAASVGLGDLFL